MQLKSIFSLRFAKLANLAIENSLMPRSPSQHSQEWIPSFDGQKEEPVALREVIGFSINDQLGGFSAKDEADFAKSIKRRSISELELRYHK